MENDVLKNRIAPWQGKGRWYHGKIDASSNTFITSDTDDFILQNAVLEISINISIYFTDPNIRVLDIKVLDRFQSLSASTNFTMGGMYITSGNQIIYHLYSGNVTSGEIEFWIFVDKE